MMGENEIGRRRAPWSTQDGRWFHAEQKQSLQTESQSIPESPNKLRIFLIVFWIVLVDLRWGICNIGEIILTGIF